MTTKHATPTANSVPPESTGSATPEEQKASSATSVEEEKPDASTEKPQRKSMVGKRAEQAAVEAEADKGAAESKEADEKAEAKAAEKKAGKAKGDAKAAEQSEDDDGEGEPQKRAPEQYEFQAPDGQEFDAETLSAFEAAARDLDLDNDQAQSILDKVAPVMAARQQATIEAQQDQWIEELTNDPELGGQHLPETLRLAALGISILPERARTLFDGPLGDHPAVVAAMREIGKRVAPDKPAGKGAAPEPKGDPTQDELLEANYPNDVVK